MTVRRKLISLLPLVVLLGTGCALWDDNYPTKSAPSGLIATPANYYSTTKARHLGTKYKDNLDRLAEHILRNSNTAQLQFANNISSVGGIGFFTHSATKTPDERYLEVVLSAPETFETKGNYSEKVNRLFSRFGRDLLGILAGDNQIYQDKDLSGYGLNLTWRQVIPGPSANRITMARAIIYFNKAKVSSFLRKETNQSELLSDAVIFAMEENGPLNLVSYQTREIKPDFRPPIREDDLAAGTREPDPGQPATAAPAGKEPRQAEEAKVATARKAISGAEAKAPPAAAKPSATAEKPLTKAPAAASPEEPPVSPAAESAAAAETLRPTKPAGAPAGGRLANPSADDAVASGQRPAQSQPVAAPPPSSLTPSSTVRSATSEDQAEKTKSGDAGSAASGPLKTAEPKPPAERVEVQPARDGDKLRETPKPAPEVEISKAPVGGRAPAAEAKIQGALPPTVANAPVALPAIEEKTIAPVPAVGPFKTSPAHEEPTPPATDLNSGETEREAKLSKPVIAGAASSKTEEVPDRGVAAISPPTIAEPAPPPVTKPAEILKETTAREPLEAAARPVAPPPEATASAPAASEPVVETLTPDRMEAPAIESPAVAALPPPVDSTPSATVSAAPNVEPAQDKAADRQGIGPAPDREFAATEKVAPPAPPLAVLPATEPADQARSTAETSPEDVAPAPAVAKVEPAPAIKPEASMPLPATTGERLNDEPEEIALLRKPAEAVAEKPAITRPALKPLEGFIIQMAFNDKEKAQRWAEKMQQRGYAVSVTEAGPEGSLRVRLGNFSVRDDAERELRSFKQDGMSGIIINLPQAFRPEVQSSVP